MKGLHTVILILLVSKCILDTYLLIYTDNWLEYDLEGKFGAYQLTYGVFHHCLMTTEIGRCIKTLPHHIDIDNGELINLKNGVQYICSFRETCTVSQCKRCFFYLAHHVVQGLSAAALVLEGLVVILHALFICYAVRKTGFVIISVLMTIDGTDGHFIHCFFY